MNIGTKKSQEIISGVILRATNRLCSDRLVGAGNVEVQRLVVLLMKLLLFQVPSASL